MAKQSEKIRRGSRGRLRIVAGIWRSRVLEIADLPGLRPTSERIRETLFNWLAPKISGARCLDLFAGTGALGLEALSRGAASAVFVEKSKAVTDTLRKNVATLGADGAQVKMAAAIEFLQDIGDDAFDIVFLDPPFAHDNVGELCRLIDEQGLLAGGAHVYLEQDRGRPAPPLPDSWSVIKNKTTGNVRYMLIAS